MKGELILNGAVDVDYLRGSLNLADCMFVSPLVFAKLSKHHLYLMSIFKHILAPKPCWVQEG